ncbi:acyl dehydratase [Rhodoligotrophos appendicifer]|uniref:MaoC family dehydratase n=1 Tax=Rhodoligotrophos appendicifer TaxID=987056 RepID=UPI00118701C6|nr:MaoC family dehydratase [Rhodoligotrophos appendicifer]
MRIYSSLAELAADEGCEIGVSQWLEITQDRINRFADATNDHQWIHVDPARARAELDMDTIAHGYLTLSLIPHFTSEIFTVASVKRMINFGANKVRFTGIVPVGSKLRGRVTLSKAVLSAASLRTISEFTIERDGVAKPVAVAEIITLFYE